MTVAAPPTQRILDADALGVQLDDVVVVDTRIPEAFANLHVPGAVNIPLRTALMEDTSRESLETLAEQARAALGSRGVTAADTLVMVDDGDGSAAVAAMIAELAGAHEVRMLLGGIFAWVNAGGELASGPGDRDAVEFGGQTSWSGLAPIEDMQSGPADGTSLLDVRSQLEHEGIVGSPCCAARGHIPGSLHLEWSRLLSASGQLLDAARIQDELAQIGLGPSDALIVYCHSGVRSALATLILRDAGFTRVRNSLGSWHEWAQRGLPLAPSLTGHSGPAHGQLIG